MKGIASAVLLTVLCTLYVAAADRTVVTGTTTNCFAGKVYPTAGVDIFLLPRTLRLTQLIEAFQTAGDEDIFKHYDELIKFVKNAKPLGRAKSDAKGSFRIEIRPVDNLVAIGYMELEDNPLYWMSSNVTINGSSSVTVALDYCKQK